MASSSNNNALTGLSDVSRSAKSDLSSSESDTASFEENLLLANTPERQQLLSEKRHASDKTSYKPRSSRSMPTGINFLGSQRLDPKQRTPVAPAIKLQGAGSPLNQRIKSKESLIDAHRGFDKSATSPPMIGPDSSKSTVDNNNTNMANTAQNLQTIDRTFKPTGIRSAQLSKNPTKKEKKSKTPATDRINKMKNTSTHIVTPTTSSELVTPFAPAQGDALLTPDEIFQRNMAQIQSYSTSVLLTNAYGTAIDPTKIENLETMRGKLLMSAERLERKKLFEGRKMARQAQMATQVPSTPTSLPATVSGNENKTKVKKNRPSGAQRRKNKLEKAAGTQPVQQNAQAKKRDGPKRDLALNTDAADGSGRHNPKVTRYASYAEVTEESNLIMAIVNVDVDNYVLTMNENETESIIKALNDATFECLSKSTFLPKFSETRGTGTCVRMRCVDGNSREWLQHTAPTLKPWAGANLKVILFTDLPKPKKVNAWFPSCNHSTADILRMLSALNPGVETTTWAVLRRNLKKNGVALYLGMDDTSLNVLRDRGLKLFFGAVMASFYPLTKEEGPEPEEEKTEAMETENAEIDNETLVDENMDDTSMSEEMNTTVIENNGLGDSSLPTSNDSVESKKNEVE